ncbi:DNA polymerase III subunit delta' [Wenyingzhuangia sp. 2_MG-2023]|uniref:DNA polymerase III subunit n=1 Tax=Wenyingzhuangia sp. 2_MG-2023 TaxID=3062639 RepID=UPI0026E13241|nr:DNA polymerase III subunit delta' [Wenyingzhuangia sp. 2_MG-2023]MDO6736694.1 DNA polymerase III subunit delta' [Wenyingzhuangia sp. 2_MG-2023]
MLFNKIIGQEHIVNHLKKTVDSGRIAHAQLFVGKEGVGTLATAIAYAQYILCNNDETCNLKTEKLQHPDLHFAFPVAVNDKVKKHPVSKLFMEEWRTFVKQNPYGSLFQWYQQLGIENKQGQMGVDEAEEIVKSLTLKSYEGGYRIMIIWMAEKMNTAASNKLLKLIEEPPSKTIFLLVVEQKEQMINTILSRCQLLEFPLLSENSIAEGLIERENTFPAEALKIAHRSEGNYKKALETLKKEGNDLEFEQLFITWVRAAFKAKGNASVIQDLIEWSDMVASFGREKQKQFLDFCLQFFRQALLLNYGAKDLVFFQPQTQGFSLEKFAPFVHGGNIESINKELNDAIYHIERNGNAKLVLLDTSIKLTRLLHVK